MIAKELELIVGDNPFHNISHLSQQRARSRFEGEFNSEIAYFAELVNLSLENGATGFMFSVSDTTLSILRSLDHEKNLNLYAIVPYAYEYVREATQVGGISGLAKKIIPQMIFSRYVKNILTNVPGLMRANPSALLNTYVGYEISRIKSAMGKNAKLKCVMLHEILTDMALALDLDWLFKSYIDFLKKNKIRPGFETRNFAYLVNKFQSWEIDFNEVTIAAPFNEIGFQMNPCKADCEKALKDFPELEVIAFSILASGYFKPEAAASYLSSLPNLNGVAIGVSKRSQAIDTFQKLSRA